ncbi:MAG: T9SS type A sorting domain-containing protein [Brumimicrobium sp.]
MKNFTLSTLIFLASIFGVCQTINAQEIILEQDGSQDEFVPGNWSVQGGGFANTDQVNVTNGGSGSLVVSNANAYTDISVEMNFSQTGTISFDLRLFEGGSEAAVETGVISDNTGTVNTVIVNFENTTPITLDALDFSNPNMTVGITYLKITGTEDATSSITEEEENNLIKVASNGKTIFVNTDIEGDFELFNLNGKKEFSSKLKSGENQITQNNLEGIYFVRLKNNVGEIVKQTKVVLL